MSKDEFISIVKMIRSLFHSDNFLESTDQLNIWYSMFAECDAKYINLAVREYAKTGRKLPVIADIMIPYNAIIEQRGKDMAQFYNTFTFTHDCYPSVFHKPDDEKFFWELIDTDAPRAETLRRLNQASRHLVEYVKYAEQNVAENEWKSYQDCMKEGFFA